MNDLKLPKGLINPFDYLTEEEIKNIIQDSITECINQKVFELMTLKSLSYGEAYFIVVNSIGGALKD